MERPRPGDRRGGGGGGERLATGEYERRGDGERPEAPYADMRPSRGGEGGRRGGDRE